MKSLWHGIFPLRLLVRELSRESVYCFGRKVIRGRQTFLGLGSGSWSDKWSNQNSNPLDGISFNFGIDIEGYLHQAYLEGNLGRLMSRPDTELIDCEGDDSPIHVVDGKKRARVINLGLLGSTMNDLSGKGNEQAKAHTWLD
ncbi:hypothetical protein Godav_026090 [Gossypium davidsonii]|uniref:Uncharacterized protein n=1 Tax=Gossypium davidsonii TaxID=34287 RepID=A0A7J8TKH4_GOSDV|nr:hypothetical protein [Gossypium davidsonii]